MSAEGKLTPLQRDTLEGWIDKGRKKFTLLYSIVRDGCDPMIFHQKCDDVGPTVTVLYTPQGSVYGGYTAANWRNEGNYVTDDRAFLYQLSASSKIKACVFPCVDDKAAIYACKTHGPNFGSSMNLRTFTENISKTGLTFKLNMNTTNWGKSYNTGGLSFASVSNGTNEVTELEVYQVQDTTIPERSKECEEQPWRKMPELNEKYLSHLKEEIENIKPRSDAKLPEVRILMVGPVGSGKSSFYNTVDSVFRGRVSRRAICASGKQSTTTRYTPYGIRSRDGSTLKFRLCDTSGIDEAHGPSLTELQFLVDGHASDNFEFNPKAQLTPKSPQFVYKPSPEQCIHSVAFVLDASAIQNEAEDVVRRLNNLRIHLHQQSIPYGIVLTNIDKVDKALQANPAGAFMSTAVREVVEAVAKLYGVPLNTIFPVKNYHDEIHLDDNVNILALMALQQLLFMAEDYTENVLARLSALNMCDGSDVTDSAVRAGRETTDSDTA